MTKFVTKRVRAGNYMAEVKVELIPDDGAWGPYISGEDAMKLDRVRQALKKGDIATASKEAEVFEVVSLTA